MNQREKRQTYWNAGRMSPALQRARLPFRNKNLITGAGILTFTFGVYAYSIAAVKQDDFSDVPAPSLERIQQINQDRERQRLLEESERSKSSSPDEHRQPLSSSPPIGLLGSTAYWIKGRNSNSEIVVGAPPLDRIGKVNDRQVSEHDQRSV